MAAGAAACLRLSFTSLVAPAGASPGQHGSPTPEPASAAFLQRVAGQLPGLGSLTASDSCAAKPGARVALPLQSQKPQLRRQARRMGHLGHIPSPRQSACSQTDVLIMFTLNKFYQSSVVSSVLL